MTITLTNEEHTLLVSTLSTHVAELREEIHRTEDYTYKMNLKHQKHLLNGLLSKLVTEEELADPTVAGH
jgi:hypothetical protein